MATKPTDVKSFLSERPSYDSFIRSIMSRGRRNLQSHSECPNVFNLEMKTPSGVRTVLHPAAVGAAQDRSEAALNGLSVLVPLPDIANTLRTA